MAHSTVRANTDAIVSIHPEDEAAVDHHAEAVQPANRGGIVAAQVLVLPLLGEVRRDSASRSPRRDFEVHFPPLARVDPGASTAFTVPAACQSLRHAAHAVEERRRESPIAEEVVVEEVQMAARQALDLRERGINRLRVEAPSAFEERFLVAEVADMRTAARDDDRVRHQVQVPLDQIAPDRRQARQRADSRIDTRAQARPCLKSARNRGKVSSPGPMKIESA